MADSDYLLEDYVPVVKYHGLNTDKDVVFGGNLTVEGTTSIAGISLTDLTVTGNTAIGNAATDTLAVNGVSTFTAGATTDAVNVVGTAITSGKAIEIVDLAALTSGIGISVTSAATAITGAGRLIFSSHSGASTTSGILNEFASAAADETVIAKITASAALTGTALQIAADSALTGSGLAISGNALTDGFGASITSSSAVLSATGRLLNVNHSGAATVSGIVAEVKSAGADETVVFQALASGLLAAGKIVNVSGLAMTTGKALSIDNLDALTTGSALSITSNSADATARNLVHIKNDHASAAGAVPLQITQDAVISTNFKLVIQFGTIAIYTSNETSPNTALTAAKGSICLNGSATGQAFWNTDGSTAWTALA